MPRVGKAMDRKAARQRAPRDAWWCCKFCINEEPASEPYDIGDSEPCTECGEGTAHVMTAAEVAKLKSEMARGQRQPERSYS